MEKKTAYTEAEAARRQAAADLEVWEKEEAARAAEKAADSTGEEDDDDDEMEDESEEGDADDPDYKQFKRQAMVDFKQKWETHKRARQDRGDRGRSRSPPPGATGAAPMAAPGTPAEECAAFRLG